MKKQWNRLLCLALCMVMVAGLLPVGMVAEASETVTVKMSESLGDGVFAYTNETMTYERPAVSEEDTQETEDFSISEELSYGAELPKLAPPVNLEWGYEYGYDGSKKAFPGSMSWQPMEPTQGQAFVEVYKVGEEMPIYSYAWHFGGGEVPEWRSIDSFCMDDPESGTYYFTVSSTGDNITYASSDPVTSDTWTYEKPSAQVGKCGNVSWNWPNVNYTAPEDMSNVGGYQVEFYYGTDADAPYYEYSSTWTYYLYGEFKPEIADWLLQQCGTGCYYFRVRALSQDITVARNGEWSEISPAYNLTELTSGVKSDLENVVNASGSMSDAEIRDAVQDMDTADLKTAMLADPNVVDDVAALENKVGGPAPVEVSDEASAFDQSKVSIVGANLNNAKSEEDPIKLVIDKPEKEHVLDTLYDSSVAVKFSMDLENVEDTRNLEVPVKITLPIPSTINPGFLVILHYHADGSVEELTLGNDVYVFEEDGQRYASFVLTSFSDFVLTQLVPAVPSVPMYRMYDPNSGEHFYSGSELERDFLVEAGWHYEGVGFNFPKVGDPVYRLYDPIFGEHLYTMDLAERSKLLDQGWNDEGVAFNSAGEDEVPQYRLHNPNAKRGGYHFTGSDLERDILIEAGWIYQGIGWYSCKK